MNLQVLYGRLILIYDKFKDFATDKIEACKNYKRLISAIRRDRGSLLLGTNNIKSVLEDELVEKLYEHADDILGVDNLSAVYLAGILESKTMDAFENFIPLLDARMEQLKGDIDKRQRILFAFQNGIQDGKINFPIEDIAYFYSSLIWEDGLSEWEISRLLGLAIYFDCEYAKEHEEHGIEQIDIINKLAQFYNSDGAIVVSADERKTLISSLWNDLSDTSDQNDFVCLMNTLIGSELKKSPCGTFVSTKYFSSFWLLITALENGVDDSFIKEYSTKLGRQKLTVNEKKHTDFRANGKFGEYNSIVSVLETIYYSLLLCSTMDKSVVLSSKSINYIIGESLKSLESHFKSVCHYLNDEQMKVICNFLEAYKKSFLNRRRTADDKLVSIEKISVSSEFWDFVGMIRDIIEQRINLRTTRYDAVLFNLPSKPIEQETGVTLPKFSYLHSCFIAGEQKLINQINHCFSGRYDTLENLPWISIFEFRKQIKDAPDTLYRKVERDKMLTALEVGAFSKLGESSISWALDDKERNIYLLASKVKPKAIDALENEKSSITLADVIDTIDGVEYIGESVSFSEDELFSIIEEVDNLDEIWNKVWEINNRRYNSDDWADVAGEVSSHIKALEMLFKGKGVSFGTFDELAKKRNVE